MPRNRSEKDLPTEVLPGGVRMWKDGRMRLHRENGPAIEWPDGEKNWYHHGELHRYGGPAIERSDGYKAWYVYNCFIRREDPNDAT